MADITKRVVDRLFREITERRVRLGTKLACGTEFDYWALLDNAMTTEKSDKVVNSEFMIRASGQFAYLQALGLKPHHRFLDYGCSILRTAWYLVPYLEPNHYVGADVSRSAMRRGVRSMMESGIARESYQLVNIRSPELIELEGFRFDFIFANSVLQYVSDFDLSVLFRAYRALATDGAIVFVSYPDESWIPALKKKGNHYRSQELMKEIGELAGFDVDARRPDPSGFPTAPHILMRPKRT